MRIEESGSGGKGKKSTLIRGLGVFAPRTGKKRACVADARDFNTSVDIIDHAMGFITAAHGASAAFYVNIWLHVSHNRLDPTAAQKGAQNQVCAARDLAITTVINSNKRGVSRYHLRTASQVFATQIRTKIISPVERLLCL